MLIVVFGVGAGVLAGLRRGPLDSSIIALSTLLAAVPSFVAAIVLIAVFAVDLDWLPALGSGSGFGGTIQHLTLPAIALAASAFAVVTRVTRVTVRSELSLRACADRDQPGDPVAAGGPPPRAAQRVDPDHDRRRDHGDLAVRAVGGGRTGVQPLRDRGGAVQAALEKDFGVVQGISLVLVGAFVVANAIVDLLYAVLDPRVAIGARAS